MQVSENISLKNYNTFGIDVNAKKFISVSSSEELRKVLQQTYASEIFILGGGSNVLLTRDINKTVLHIGLTGRQIISETENEVVVEANAGENWHQFVLWTLEHDFGGLENLSLIPGNVGTAPIQNIGAYGVELKDVFESCTAIRIQTLEEINFKPEDCEFGYRNSVFKQRLKGEYIITSVRFRLSKTQHKLHTGYGAINDWLIREKITKPGIKDISNAVIAIRQSKLPDPRVLGNSGSFFKNPVIRREEYLKLQEKFPGIPSYPIDENLVKVPAGWLIDKAGLKGYRRGDAGVHQNQALVLVNYGEATGEELLDLSYEIKNQIYSEFGIKLEAEVNIF
ncbi:MAG: UDP-N-acetylmuramate dehydrogenase [Salegentibacter sp.]|uniref:UDP-N-acetylmuramate dehydrogenase n=1 Tax=Salegentibacter sp. TaxID=1903072 RepID=UPI00286FB572|nr:UDP-N-acetylmuramate dehydrogenase [Salegentibacter sp.]MDR9456525.1 UDP-N-acetylmuramate dehydrogenase [Salegentibacter sp.]